MNKASFLGLIDKYLKGQASLEEQKRIVNYYESFQNTKGWIDVSMASEEAMRLEILDKIRADLNFRNHVAPSHKPDIDQNKIKYILKSNMYKYAAILIVMIGIGYFLKSNLTEKGSTLEGIIVDSNSMDSEEITLSLANGNVEVILEQGDRELYDAGGHVVGVQKGNELNYTEQGASKIEAFVYNELTIPYGKRFDLVLSDGTHVKLNAGTAIKYPVQFIKGKKRIVYIKGEAYFDVKKDKDHPFIVNANNINVEVLGTEFNMSFYPEDEAINTVLVEGSVKLYQNNKGIENKYIMLSPGYKATWNRLEEKMSVDQVDIRIYTAWKEGHLIFKRTSFADILKKLERKFNVRIENKYNYLDQQIYTGTFLNNETIEDILKYFSKEASFNYSKNDNKIIITPDTNNN